MSHDHEDIDQLQNPENKTTLPGDVDHVMAVEDKRKVLTLISSAGEGYSESDAALGASVAGVMAAP